VRALCARPGRTARGGLRESDLVDLVADELVGSEVRPCAVVGFPLGATQAMIKVAETHAVVTLGAREVDMVIQIGALKGGDDALVLDEIRDVCEAPTRAAPCAR